MNKAVKSCWISIGFLVSLSGPAWAEASSVSQAQEAPPIVVRVYDYADVPAGTLKAAQREAGRIFREAGVAAVWLRCALNEEELAQNRSCLTAREPRAVNVRLLPRSMAEKAGYAVSDFGYAVLPEEGELASDLSVFYHLVGNLAESRIATPPVILGHVLAHEIGHLLLGAGSHSAKGIMHVPWRRKDLRKASRGLLGFTPSQARRMRVNLARRAGRERQPSPRKTAGDAR